MSPNPGEPFDFVSRKDAADAIRRHYDWLASPEPAQQQAAAEERAARRWRLATARDQLNELAGVEEWARRELEDPAAQVDRAAHLVAEVPAQLGKLVTSVDALESDLRQHLAWFERALDPYAEVLPDELQSRARMAANFAFEWESEMRGKLSEVGEITDSLRTVYRVAAAADEALDSIMRRNRQAEGEPLSAPNWDDFSRKALRLADNDVPDALQKMASPYGSIGAMQDLPRSLTYGDPRRAISDLLADSRALIVATTSAREAITELVGAVGTQAEQIGTMRTAVAQLENTLTERSKAHRSQEDQVNNEAYALMHYPEFQPPTLVARQQADQAIATEIKRRLDDPGDVTFDERIDRDAFKSASPFKQSAVVTALAAEIGFGLVWGADSLRSLQRGEVRTSHAAATAQAADVVSAVREATTSAPGILRGPELELPVQQSLVG